MRFAPLDTWPWIASRSFPFKQKQFLTKKARFCNGFRENGPHIKKTPCIAARCHFAFWFNDFFSKHRREDPFRGLPRGGLPCLRCLAASWLTAQSACLTEHSSRGFCFPGLPARRSPISLGAPSADGPGCVSSGPSD